MAENKIRIKNAKLANATISTAFGTFKLDSEGAIKLPAEIAETLVKDIAGFIVVDDKGNPIELPKADVEEPVKEEEPKKEEPKKGKTA